MVHKIENIGFIGLALVVILGFLYIILGLSAMMAALGIILFFVVPFYLLLNNFKLEQDEKMISSFFMGVGIFPSIAYWLGMYISFRISIFITFLILLIAAYLMNRFRKK